MPQPLRIFVSSPGDVKEERLRAQMVIQKLARDYAGLVALKPYFWESEPLRATGHFQDEIEPPSTHDIFVLILWSRLGTPLPVRTTVREYRGIDGRTPVTGTEWEFEDALAGFRANNTPDLLVYRRRGDPGSSLTDDAKRLDQERQWRALQDFWRLYFEKDGEFIAASTKYGNLDEFDAKLEASLAKIIERKIRDRAGADPSALYLKGTPYRGLSAYEFADAPVFFGRDGAIRSGLTRLLSASAAGTSFLLVLGASGSGKSSLARAGLLPALVAAKAVPGVGLWRRVVLRPGDAGPDPVQALAAALLGGDPRAGEGLPELGGTAADAAELAAHLRIASADPSFPFRIALRTLAERERTARALLSHEDARLVLLVDQLEELFTRPGIPEADKALFVGLLAGLARSGSVWVVATIRSDLWHRAAELPELLRLTEEGARLDLLPPDGAELLEMVRRPARAVGLGFDEDPESGLALDAVLAEAATAAPGALPLLSVVLEDLYRRDVLDATENRGPLRLTFASYRAIGGLDGAIATRAELVVTGLEARDPDAAAALPEVLRALVTTSAGDAVTSRPAPLGAFPPGSPARRLVGAMLAPDARLLTVAGDGGEPELRLAHEALISFWPRAARQVELDRRDIETRAQLESLLRSYQLEKAGGRSEGLLTGLALEQGLDLTRRWHLPELSPLGGFVAASARRRRFVRLRGYAVAAVLVLVFAGIATLAGFQTVEAGRRAAEIARVAQREAEARRLADQNASAAEEARRLADRNASAAEDARALAERRTVEARTNETRASTEAARAEAALRDGAALEADRIAAISHQLIDDGRAALAEALALRVSPRLKGQADRPLTSRTAGALSRALRVDDELGRVTTGENALRVVVSPDETVAVVGLSQGQDGGRLQFWSLPDLVLKRSVRAHEDNVTSLELSPDGRSVLVAGGKVPSVWDIARAEKRFDLQVSNPAKFIKSAFYSPDGSTIATGGGDNRVQVFEAATGRLLRVIAGPDFAAGYKRAGERAEKAGTSFGSADSIAAAVAQANFRIWGATTEVAWSPDGRTLAVSGPGDPEVAVRLFDVATGRPKAVLTGTATNLMGGIMGYGRSLQFSASGQVLAAIAAPAAINLFDPNKPGPARQLSATDVDTILMDKKGRLLLAGHGNGSITVWCVPKGELRATLVAHKEGIEDLRFDAGETTFASTSADGTAATWAVPPDDAVCPERAQYGDGGRLLMKPVTVLEGHRSIVNRLAFLAGGDRLLTASRDGTVRLWRGFERGFARLARPRDAAPLGWSEFRASPRLALSRDGTRAAVIGDGRSEVWNLAAGSRLAAPDTDRIALERTGGEVSAYRNPFASKVVVTATGAPPPEAEGDDPLSDPRWLISDLSWEISPDGTRALGIPAWLDPKDGSSTLGDESPPVLLGTDPERLVAPLGIGELVPDRPGFSADGSTVVSRLTLKGGRYDQDGRRILAVWDARSGRLLGRSAELRGDRILVASRDGRTLLAYGIDTGRRDRHQFERSTVFRLTNESLAPVPLVLAGGRSEAFQRQVRAAALSRDGEFAAAGHSDGSVLVWSTRDGALLADLVSATDPVSAIALSDGGAYVAVADASHRVWLIDRNGDFPVATPRLPEPVAELSFTPDGRALVALGESGTLYVVERAPLPGLDRDEDVLDWLRASLPEDISGGERRRYRLEAPRLLSRPDLADLRPLPVPPVRPAGSRASTLAACDRLAADPLDRDRAARGVPWSDLALGEALPACGTAATEAPEDLRTRYQLGRLLWRADRLAEAVGHLRFAADRDYAAAAESLGRLRGGPAGAGFPELGSPETWLERARALGDPAALLLHGVRLAAEAGPLSIEEALDAVLAAADTRPSRAALTIGEMLEDDAGDDRGRRTRALLFYLLGFWLSGNVEQPPPAEDEPALESRLAERTRRLVASLPAPTVVATYRTARDWRTGPSR